MKKFAFPVAMLAVLLLGATAHAVQFDYLATGFSQQIFTDPLPAGAAPGMVWTSGGNLLIKSGTNILEYSLSTVPPQHQGTNVHKVAVTHNIPGLFSGTNSGVGMTEGLDGNIYIATSIGLQRFSSTLTGSATTIPLTVAGPGYGITTLPDGRIAYVGGWSSSDVYIYDPSGGTNTWIYSAPSLIDDIEASASGAIALALQPINMLAVITTSGSVTNSFSTLSHHPDGLAFGEGPTVNWLYSNNNDGSISQYQLGPGYSGTPVIVDIALQTLPIPSGKAYGDLASVGPDCAFYVSQFQNNGINGCTPGTGTHWDNGVTNAEASIVRIAAVQRNPDGTETEYCGFGYATESVPEPGSLLALGTGLLALGGMLKRRK